MLTGRIVLDLKTVENLLIKFFGKRDSFEVEG